MLKRAKKVLKNAKNFLAFTPLDIEVEEEDEFAEGVRKEEKVFFVSPEDERQGLLNKAGREQERETDLRFSLRKRKNMK